MNVFEYDDAARNCGIPQKREKNIAAEVVDLFNMGYGGNMGDYLRTCKEYRDAVVLCYSSLTKQQFNVKIIEKTQNLLYP